MSLMHASEGKVEVVEVLVVVTAVVVDDGAGVGRVEVAVVAQLLVGHIASYVLIHRPGGMGRLFTVHNLSDTLAHAFAFIIRRVPLLRETHDDTKLTLRRSPLSLLWTVCALID